MNRDQLVLAVSACGAVLGVALVVGGLAGGQPEAVTPRRPRLAPVVGVVTFVALVALTGWLVPAAIVGAIVWAGVTAGSTTRSPGFQRERVEALASWTESVRDVMQAGSQPVGAIGATAASSPVIIRTAVRSLHARLSAGHSAETTLRRFADDLDDPLGDLVAIGLLIAITRGAQTDAVLSSLATQARHHADRRRIVEAERAPRRREVQALAAIMSLLFGLVFVFARTSYLRAYEAVEGQVFLALLIAAFGALLWRVAALARFPLPSRFLSVRGES